MNTLIPFLYVSFTGCLDPKINVDVNIERVEDTASDSTDVDNNSQPSSEPSQPANEPTGDPNDDGGGGDPNDGGGGDPNDPNDRDDPDDPNDPNYPNPGVAGSPLGVAVVAAKLKISKIAISKQTLDFRFLFGFGKAPFPSRFGAETCFFYIA